MNTNRIVLLAIAALALHQAASAGPAVIKPRVDRCTVSPDAEGCTPAVTKPPADECIVSPDAEGCTPAVTKPPLNRCAVWPESEGCSPAVTKRRVSYSKKCPCKEGYVWRLAGPEDYVCVSPEWARRAQLDNEADDSNSYNAGGDEGHHCNEGLVFRYAFVSDEVCVTPEVQAATRDQNRSSPRHSACNDPGFVTKRSGGVVQPE